MTISLQQVLGTDNTNLSGFSVYKDQLVPPNLYVYFGAALMEIVPADKKAAEYKLLVARLYNAGIKKKNLKKNFNVGAKTARRWGEGLKSNDPEQLAKALSGSGAPRKLTTEIRAFIEVRFSYIYKETKYNYSSRIREELKAVFNVDISSESLRLLFKELKVKFNSLEPVPEFKEENSKEPYACDSKELDFVIIWGP